ncbi:MAG: hypothetical protein WD512_17560 [Candidatus Paceibacterota bacterium]
MHYTKKASNRTLLLIGVAVSALIGIQFKSIVKLLQIQKRAQMAENCVLAMREYIINKNQDSFRQMENLCEGVPRIINRSLLIIEDGVIYKSDPQNLYIKFILKKLPPKPISPT